MFIFRKLGAILWDFLETFVIAGALFAVIYFFLFRPFQVIGHSMDPSYMDGENVLTNIISLKFSTLKRGDVVVFEALPPNQERDYIKRVIGLPGDKVMIKDGKVYINDAMLDESNYLQETVKTAPRMFLQEGQEVVVPPNSYFVLGDNRENSSDSREWGYVSNEKVIGKTSLVYWPLTRFRKINDIIY